MHSPRLCTTSHVAYFKAWRPCMFRGPDCSRSYGGEDLMRRRRREIQNGIEVICSCGCGCSRGRGAAGAVA
eukprot:12218783-Karenia_brevis.AAC.1